MAKQRAASDVAVNQPVIPPENPQTNFPFIPKRVFNVEEAAFYCGCTNWFMETLLREGSVFSWMQGNRKVVDRADLDRYLDETKARLKREAEARLKREAA